MDIWEKQRLWPPTETPLGKKRATHPQFSKALSEEKVEYHATQGPL